MSLVSVAAPNSLIEAARSLLEGVTPALENRLCDKRRGRHRRRGCRGELISLDECTGIRLFLILQHSLVLDRDQQERVGDTLLYFVWRRRSNGE